jgi:hypothetical protein
MRAANYRSSRFATPMRWLANNYAESVKLHSPGLPRKRLPWDMVASTPSTLKGLHRHPRVLVQPFQGWR